MLGAILGPLLLTLQLCVAAPAEDRGLFDRTFDYVIVGGGTAGLALAARLTENPKIQVAVIEAGTYYQVSNIFFSSTPGADVLFAGSSPSGINTLVDWNFITAPQKGAANRKVHYARGKCLGGSSARNFMVYQRPEVGSMQMWADAVGDSSYTLDKMMPYFKKSATFTPPQSPPRHPNSTVQHDASVFDNSQGGPVQVTYSKYGAPFSTWMQPALSEIGLPQAVDFNGGTLDGHNWCTSTLDPKTMKRSSSQTAFLDQSQSRWNLHVQQLTTARKIIFDGNKTATGVQLSTGSTFFARKEVILSAGAFQSPQLLMVSGVGPAATLDKFNIPIIADRPGVGQNLTDHVFASPSYRVNVQTYTKLGNSIAYILWEFATNFLLKAGGVLTDPVCSYIGWEKLPVHLLSDETRSQLSQFPSTWPHIEYISAPGYIGDFSNLLTNQPKDGYQYASILAALVSPLSRGTVTITSSSTSDLPVIDPNWLSHPVDQAVMVAAYKRVRAAFASKAMAPILADPVEYYPGPDVHTDEQILDTIRKDVMTVWHAACTCRMGRVDDPTAVVDNKARVIGVNNLRVVDASAFALLPPGHPTSTIYALAEKIADDIKSGW